MDSTPEALRRSAWRGIEDARALLARGSYAEAADRAGHVVACALRARYCTRRRWPAWPPRDEADPRRVPPLQRGEVEELLRLSDDVAIAPRSLPHIDWARATDWGAEPRPAPPDAVSREEATALVGEAEALHRELAAYELVEQLAAVERAISRERGRFTLFALVRRDDHAPWTVLMSAWWLAFLASDDAAAAASAAIRARIEAGVAPDLLPLLGGGRFLAPDDPLVEAFHAMGRATGTLTEHLPHQIRAPDPGRRVPLPRGFVITNLPLPPP